jgi:hypothetical protein
MVWSVSGRYRTAPLGVGLLGDLKRVVDLYSKVAYGALERRVPEEPL